MYKMHCRRKHGDYVVFNIAVEILAMYISVTTTMQVGENVHEVWKSQEHLTATEGYVHPKMFERSGRLFNSDD